MRGGSGGGGSRFQTREVGMVMTQIRDEHVFRALGALAAMLEEERLPCTRHELRAAVVAHGRLCDALGLERDYSWRRGAVVCTRGDGRPIKRPSPCEPVFPCGERVDLEL